MVYAGNVKMLFIEGGGKCLLLQLTVLKVVIKVGCAADPDKNWTFDRTCDVKPTQV